MATVDIDLSLPVSENVEPVIVTLSIEEVRVILHKGIRFTDLHDELQNFIEEYDAHGH
jgi:hypothetical protein